MGKENGHERIGEVDRELEVFSGFSMFLELLEWLHRAPSSLGSMLLTVASTPPSLSSCHPAIRRATEEPEKPEEPGEDQRS